MMPPLRTVIMVDNVYMMGQARAHVIALTPVMKETGVKITSMTVWELTAVVMERVLTWSMATSAIVIVAEQEMTVNRMSPTAACWEVEHPAAMEALAMRAKLQMMKAISRQMLSTVNVWIPGKEHCVMKGKTNAWTMNVSMENALMGRMDLAVNVTLAMRESIVAQTLMIVHLTHVSTVVLALMALLPLTAIALMTTKENNAKTRKTSAYLIPVPMVVPVIQVAQPLSVYVHLVTLMKTVAQVLTSVPCMAARMAALAPTTSMCQKALLASVTLQTLMGIHVR
jgi:hypothetical protein